MNDCTLTCGAGYYHFVTSTEARCEVCPAAHYCPANTEDPVLCPAGTTNEVQSATSVAECHPCPPGFYCSGEDVSNVQVQCPQDTYCPEGSTKPTACADGKVTEIQGAVSPDECLLCNLGFYKDSETSRCSPCPENTFCPANAEEPSPCPGGTYHADTGKVDQDSCLSCDAGFFCPEG